MFSENVLHTVVNLPQGVRDAPLPPEVQRVGIPTFVGVLLSHCAVPTDLFSASSVSPHSCTVVPSLRDGIDLADPISVEAISDFRSVYDKKCHDVPLVHLVPTSFLFAIQSSAPAHSEAGSTQTVPRLCHVHVCFYPV